MLNFRPEAWLERRTRAGSVLERAQAMIWLNRWRDLWRDFLRDFLRDFWQFPSEAMFQLFGYTAIAAVLLLTVHARFADWEWLWRAQWRAALPALVMGAAVVLSLHWALAKQGCRWRAELYGYLLTQRACRLGMRKLWRQRLSGVFLLSPLWLWLAPGYWLLGWLLAIAIGWLMPAPNWGRENSPHAHGLRHAVRSTWLPNPLARSLQAGISYVRAGYTLLAQLALILFGVANFAEQSWLLPNLLFAASLLPGLWMSPDTHALRRLLTAQPLPHAPRLFAQFQLVLALQICALVLCLLAAHYCAISMWTALLMSACGAAVAGLRLMSLAAQPGSFSPARAQSYAAQQFTLQLALLLVTYQGLGFIGALLYLLFALAWLLQRALRSSRYIG